MNISFIPNINKEGYVFIAIAFVLSCVASAISWGLGVIFFFLTLFCIYFFRDPARVVPADENLILSPADGIVCKIEEVISPLSSEIEDKVVCVSIFLDVLNIHVNRIPISGVVKSKEYRPGRFVSANLDKASEDNERQRIVVESKDGHIIVVDQIAGLIARRIVCNLKENQSVKSGERFGIIRFGSRVNIYLPKDVKPLVSEGQTMVGGETVVANLKELEHKALVFSII